MTGVGCYSKGCDEDVVGQCVGYGGSCGRFYCRHHSGDILCSECAAKKALDVQKSAVEAEILRVRDEYAHTLKGLPNKSGRLPYFLAMFPAVIAVLILFNANAANIGQAIGTAFALFILAVPGIWYCVWKNKEAKSALTEAERTKPEFRTFYEKMRLFEAKAKANIREDDAEKAAAIREMLDLFRLWSRQAGRNLTERGEWVGELAFDEGARDSLVELVVQDMVRRLNEQFEAEDAQAVSGQDGSRQGAPAARTALGVGMTALGLFGGLVSAAAGAT